MAVAVFIKSESGDNYLKVWDDPQQDDVYNWVLDETDLPADYEVSVCGPHIYSIYELEIKRASTQLWFGDK